MTGKQDREKTELHKAINRLRLVCAEVKQLFPSELKETGSIDPGSFKELFELRIDKKSGFPPVTKLKDSINLKRASLFNKVSLLSFLMEKEELVDYLTLIKSLSVREAIILLNTQTSAHGLLFDLSECSMPEQQDLVLKQLKSFGYSIKRHLLLEFFVSKDKTEPPPTVTNEYFQTVIRTCFSDEEIKKLLDVDFFKLVVSKQKAIDLNFIWEKMSLESKRNLLSTIQEEQSPYKYFRQQLLNQIFSRNIDFDNVKNGDIPVQRDWHFAAKLCKSQLSDALSENRLALLHHGYSEFLSDFATDRYMTKESRKIHNMLCMGFSGVFLDEVQTLGVEAQANVLVDEDFLKMKQLMEHHPDSSVKSNFYLQSLARLAYYKDGLQMVSVGSSGGDDKDVFAANPRGAKDKVKKELIVLHGKLTMLRDTYKSLLVKKTDDYQKQIDDLSKQWTKNVTDTKKSLGSLLNDPINAVLNALLFIPLLVFNASNAIEGKEIRFFKFTEQSKAPDQLVQIEHQEFNKKP